MAKYYYTKTNVNITALTCEIQSEATISGGFDYAYFDSPNYLEVNFFRDLYSNEQTALDTVVSGHDGQALSQEEFEECYGVSGDIYYDDQEQEPTVDPLTGISGSWLMMEVLRISRDLYNDEDNLLYVEGHKPVFGTGSYVEDLEAKPDTFIELSDTPNTYTSGKYLRTTTSGVEGTDVETGTTNLDGGFAAAVYGGIEGIDGGGADSF
jgi:hypothetical protein